MPHFKRRWPPLARIAADRAGALVAAGLSSGLAFLVLALLEPLASHDDQDEVGDLVLTIAGGQWFEQRQHQKCQAGGQASGGQRARAIGGDASLEAANVA